MDWTTTHLETLLANIWTKLQMACKDKSHPWRNPVFTTVNVNRPAGRVVVLRAVDPKSRVLVCYSDVRANKIQQIYSHPWSEWVFYDPVESMQLRVLGRTIVHHEDKEAEAAWRSQSINHLHYLSPLAPGTGLPATLPTEIPAEEEGQLAFQNFALLSTIAERMDWLHVGETSDRRAAFEWVEGRLHAIWMVP